MSRLDEAVLVQVPIHLLLESQAMIVIDLV
jgi:hypothetical protein